MTKLFLRLIPGIAAYLLLFGAQTTAQSYVPITVSAAYSKSSSQQYDVVVKDTPGTKLVLYINDKSPSYATVNKKDWATFHKVTLNDSNKVSFAKQLKGKNGKTYQSPINYVRYVHISNGGASFTAAQTTPPPASPPTSQPKAAATPPPPPAQTPAPPSCTPLTNGGNCYEPGEYCRVSDRGTSGIAGDGKSITCTDNNGWRWEPN
jgi:hypothetical protein